MSQNLILERWIPVRRRSGERERIAPWQVTDNLDDPVVGIDTMRPDFSGALMQFLIGIFQTTIAPARERQWKDLLLGALNPEEIRERMQEMEHAFILDSDGPRFMQDPGVSGEKRKSIGALLIDTPGAKGEREGKAFFVKPGRTGVLCPSCAATALFTMQTNAPAGGRGFRTSIRGGGPLTTVLLGDTLWHTIMLNILSRESLGNVSDRVFPWLGEIPTSSDKEMITPDDVPPLQMYWAMPRRIFLHFITNDLGDTCDVCGLKRDVVVREYSELSYGPNYQSGVWAHPLTPSYASDEVPFNPIHAHAGCTLYRHWIGYVQPDSDDTHHPAPVVREFVYPRSVDLQDRTGTDWTVRLWTFGYDMDNMKARCWYDGTMPVHTVPADHRVRFEQCVANTIDAARMVADNTTRAVKKGLLGSIERITNTKWAKWHFPKSAKNNRTLLYGIGEAFWQDTEEAFFDMLRAIRADLIMGHNMDETMRSWLHFLRHASVTLFSIHVESGDMRTADPRVLARARTELQWENNSRKLYDTLELPVDTGDDEQHTEDQV